MARALARSDLANIDLTKLGPDSPLRPMVLRAQRAVARGPKRDLEHQEQVKLFAWAAEHQAQFPALRWLFAVPNWFGTRTAKQGARAKAEGRKSGVPDIWLPVPRGSYRGLVFEMKSPGKYPTPEQRAWLEMLRANRWLTDTCRSAAEAQQLLVDYLNER